MFFLLNLKSNIPFSDLFSISSIIEIRGYLKGVETLKKNNQMFENLS